MKQKTTFNVQVHMDIRMFTELAKTFIEKDKIMPRSNSDLLRMVVVIAHRHIVPAEIRDTMSTEQAMNYLEKHRFSLPQDKRMLRRLLSEAAWENEEAEQAQMAEEGKSVTDDVKRALEGVEIEGGE